MRSSPIRCGLFKPHWVADRGTSQRQLYHRVRSESQTFIGATLDFAIACSRSGKLSNAAGTGSASPPLAINSSRTSSGVLARYWSLSPNIMPERTPFLSLSGGRGMGPCAARALNQTGEPSGKSNLPSEVRLPSTSAATSAGGSRTSIICNQSILAFAPFLFSVEIALRIRITVFGGSLPSEPSGKVNFMNEFGVVTLVALCSMPLAADGAIWPEAAGEVAARYRPKGKTEPQMANKRFMDMCSQLTKIRDIPRGTAAIMLVLHDDAKHDMACRSASRHESRHFHPGLVRRGEEGRGGSSSA
jgi:hypothetical protein